MNLREVLRYSWPLLIVGAGACHEGRDSSSPSDELIFKAFTVDKSQVELGETVRFTLVVSGIDDAENCSIISQKNQQNVSVVLQLLANQEKVFDVVVNGSDSFQARCGTKIYEKQLQVTVAAADIPLLIEPIQLLTPQQATIPVDGFARFHFAKKNVHFDSAQDVAYRVVVDKGDESVIYSSDDPEPGVEVTFDYKKQVIVFSFISSYPDPLPVGNQDRIETTLSAKQKEKFDLQGELVSKALVSNEVSPIAPLKISLKSETLTTSPDQFNGLIAKFVSADKHEIDPEIVTAELKRGGDTFPVEFKLQKNEQSTLVMLNEGASDILPLKKDDVFLVVISGDEFDGTLEGGLDVCCNDFSPISLSLDYIDEDYILESTYDQRLPKGSLGKFTWDKDVDFDSVHDLKISVDWMRDEKIVRTFDLSSEGFFGGPVFDLAFDSKKRVLDVRFSGNIIDGEFAENDSFLLTIDSAEESAFQLKVDQDSLSEIID